MERQALGSDMAKVDEQNQRDLPFLARREPLDGRFAQYHADNPQVLDLFVQYTRHLKVEGFSCYSAKAVIERIRWHYVVETKDDQGFKLNNNYTSRYVRLLEEKHPELLGFYHKRELKS